MKPILFISLSLLLTSKNAFTQGACSNIKVETPVVSKPTAGSIVSATCTALTVKWQGNANQSYVVKGIRNNSSANTTDTAVAANVSCDVSLNCTATIPVSAGILVSWTVQASQVIDKRTFYSYPFRGDQDYAIPPCKRPVTKAANAQSSITDLTGKNKLVIFPNPVSGELTFNWSGEYLGAASMTIIDGSGKEIKQISIKKDQAIYINRMQVKSFRSGIYYLNIRTSKGQTMTTRFVKE